MPTFATCSFPEYFPEQMGGLPVRSSNGTPRYKLRYPLTYALPQTFPDKWTMALPLDQFVVKYTERIARIGTGAIRAQVDDIRQRAGVDEDTPLVLLCFEQLAKKPGSWCHRNVFAAVWTELTGEDVPEYGQRPHAELRSQESLF